MSNQPHTGHAKGSRHWRWQRITAIGLIPLTLWFLFAIARHIGDDHSAITEWIARPRVAVLLVLYMVIVFFHGQLGLQEVIRDYIHHVRIKRTCSLSVKLILLAAALAAVISIARIAA